MFIAVTRIKAPKEHQERMAEAFRQAAPALKQFSGFLGFELWRGEDTLEAVSRWESREAMEAYTHSGMFQAHHPAPGGEQRQGEGHGAGQQGAAHGAGSGGGQVAHYEGEVVV